MGLKWWEAALGFVLVWFDFFPYCYISNKLGLWLSVLLLLRKSLGFIKRNWVVTVDNTYLSISLHMYKSPGLWVSEEMIIIGWRGRGTKKH